MSGPTTDAAGGPTRLALVHYAPRYFMPFARALADEGFDVHWVCALRSDARWLRQAGVPASKVLDTTLPTRPITTDVRAQRAALASLERPGSPRLNDIVLMDRVLRDKRPGFALGYLAHLERELTSFLRANRIELVSSGRDTALNLVSMLVARREGIPWVVPTRARIPQEMYGFCTGHETAGLVPLREPGPDDERWAERFCDEFVNKALRPALKKSARDLGDVLRLLPSHARAFWAEARRSTADRGNDYSRYPLPRLVGMYLRRRLNLIAYKLAPPYAPRGDGPFCLYTLHTQPESSIDVSGSYFSDQIALITAIARSLPVTHELWVKVHPTDVDGKSLVYYRRIAAIPGVRLVSHALDTRQLLGEASLVFALTGTVAYEAGLMGRPVIVFAHNYFNELPTIRYCGAPPELPQLIAEQLDRPAPADAAARIVAFLARLRASCVDGEVNRTYGASSAPLTAADLVSLRRVYRRLAELLVVRPGQSS